MATKKASTAVAVAEPKKTAVALPASVLAELANEAKEASANETPSIGNLSFKSGILAYEGNPLPDNKLDCIVVGTAYERALYDGPYDPNKIKSPVCFAITADGEDGAPHANSLHPQHETCAGCPMNEWGSAGEGRRGKACKEIRRLALIPTDKLESPQDIMESELVMAKVPVTSVKNWSNYVHKVSAMFGMPYWAMVSNINLHPHIKNQFEVKFDAVEPIQEMEALEALKKKRGLVESFIMAPYSQAAEEEEAPPPPPKASIKKKF